MIRLLDEADAELVARIGRLDTKHFGPLVQDLETLNLGKRDLLAHGVRIDGDVLLGRGPSRCEGAKTRLSIISTKFLSAEDALFFIAQLFIELGRWTSRNPSSDLQAVVLLDEADHYLPASRKPPTKEPIESLLRRARSAGLGVLLATQSPGDFDYKCRENLKTWFAGQVTQPTALRKLEPMFSECRVDVGSKLPVQPTGHFHMLRDGVATAFAGRLNLVPPQQRSDDDILALARGTVAVGTV
jgi:hypothetical protein